jgi:hypothetical protein
LGALPLEERALIILQRILAVETMAGHLGAIFVGVLKDRAPGSVPYDYTPDQGVGPKHWVGDWPAYTAHRQGEAKRRILRRDKGIKARYIQIYLAPAADNVRYYIWEYFDRSASDISGWTWCLIHAWFYM